MQTHLNGYFLAQFYLSVRFIAGIDF